MLKDQRVGKKRRKKKVEKRGEVIDPTAFLQVHVKELSPACSYSWPFSTRVHRNIFGGLVLLSLVS